MLIKCIKQYQNKRYAFKEGETYKGSQINDIWWVIDAVGINVEDFNEYFKIEGTQANLVDKSNGMAE